MKKLFLIDAYALIYRAYYAFLKRPIMTASGIDTSAIFGFTKSIFEILKKEKPTHVAVAFDPYEGKTFRHEMYSEYKANRLKSPEVIKNSISAIKEILANMGISTFEIDGYEADDIIGTLAKIAERNSFQVYMVTPDKDYAQLVSESIFMYKPKHSGNDVEIWGINEVCANFGINKPEQVVDILAIWGDASDNVPGMPGIGEKGATKLVQEFGNVACLLENTDKLSEKQQKIFAENRERLLLSHQLVTINTNVPLRFDENSLLKHDADNEKLTAILQKYEFASLLRELKGNEPPKIIQTDLFGNSIFEQKPQHVENISMFKTINDVSHNYKIVKTDSEIDELVRLLLAQKEICFDTETEGFDYFSDKLAGISFAVKPYEGYYVPICEKHEGNKSFIEKLRPVFENGEISKIGQNIKFDCLFLKSYGINVCGFLFDTMLADYLLNPELRHNMNLLSEKYLSYSPVKIETLIGEKGKNQKKISQAPLEAVAEYAIEDADVTLQLKYVLEDELKKNNLYKLYCDIESPLISILADMEYAGVRIDSEKLNVFGKKLNAQLLELDNDIKKMTDEPSLNISSPKQLGVVLFEKMGLNDNAKRTKTKQYSTDEETLMSMRGKHPVINKILEYRSIKKLLSTYVEALPELINKKTGRIHTSFNQAITATGRLSSSNPNLQNIPVREEDGREIRKAFIASDQNHVLVSADYSQIELRLMAHVSEDKNLIKAFNSDEDIHTSTAAKIYHISNAEVTREQRTKAKTANFGIIYGISAFGLAQRLNISNREANELINGYFQLYPDVKTYMNRSIDKAREQGFAETIFGRKRRLPNITSGNAVVRGLAERNAINTPIQGSAADIIKIAMIKITDRLRHENLSAKMILQVHDELIFDVEKSELEKALSIISTEMQNAANLRVPLTVEANYGNNWIEAH
ncbi:MAG: DNA polymerase I [Prevotellaceae bacterium]|jgi:DNA polymerase-1|nr:DNA polymerase I [Prevotellaceae bacterium]